MSKKLSYNSLNLSDKKYFTEHIWNGVGSSQLNIKIKSYIFNGPSKPHDFEYWVRGNEIDRLKADINFFKNCLKVLRLATWYKKPIYLLMSIFYFIILILFGWLTYEYGTRCETFEELKEFYKNKTLN